MQGLRSAKLVLVFASVSLARAEDPPLAEYFRVETARIAAKPLLGIESAEVWKARRPELQQKLKAMLGLVPEPPRGDLNVQVRGTVERPDFLVERIVYQSLPGLYVTANVFRPKTPIGRLPAILYVCGHSRVEKDGVIYGCKAHYQHHAAWFAANGYVCLIVDTLQLGEVPGEHHGTFSQGKWWWQSRGYTPAGIEAWNAVRGIDYLVSRPDVDPSRVGVTGRSGGGATSWWVGAIDDRVAAVCPVAGITDLTNHVVDNVVEGHCDCMYFTNTERWDYTMLAALVAPKPLLVENTDKDPIFPEDGVRRIYAQVEKVYGWYGKSDLVSLIVGKGGHADTEELRHPAFAFFERYLKGKPDATIVEPDRKVPIEDLKVLNKGETFADARNGKIDETFIPLFVPPNVPATVAEWKTMKAGWMETIKKEVVAGWPSDEEAGPLEVKEVSSVNRDGICMREYNFTSQSGVRLTMWTFSTLEDAARKRLRIEVFGEYEWLSEGTPIILAFTGDAGDAATPKIDPTRLNLSKEIVTVFVTPRAVGPTTRPKAQDTHFRRRFLLLGQTLDGMRAYDVRRAIQATGQIQELQGVETIELVGKRSSAPIAVVAALFEPKVSQVELKGSPSTIEGGPAFLNLSRSLGMPQLAALVEPRALRIDDAQGPSWRWTVDLGKMLGLGRDWPSTPSK